MAPRLAFGPFSAILPSVLPMRGYIGRRRGRHQNAIKYRREINSVQ